MSGEPDNKGVTSVERIEVTPAEGNDDIIESEDTDPESPQGNEGESGTEGGDQDPDTDPDDESPDGKPEGIRRQPTQSANAEPAGDQEVTPVAPASDPSNPQNLKRQPNETAREFALRSELTKTRSLLRTQRTEEIMGTIRPNAPAATEKPTLDERTQQVLAKYPKEQLDALREVFPALATEMGFVRKDEIAGSTYTEKAQDTLDGFLTRHPEYLPENDPEGTLWNAFKTEFGQYKQPTNPKDYARLFEKVHNEVFGIQPSGNLPKVSAAERKVQVASHAGASGPTAPSRQSRRDSGASSGLRLDMLKGFDDETKERIANRAVGE